MKRILGLISGLVFALASSSAIAGHHQTAFVGVYVVPMDANRVLENQTVLVEGDRIVAIGGTGTIAVPKDATVVDGKGLYLMPGLAEMHAHVPAPGDSAFDPEEILFLYVSRGITTARGMQGRPGQLKFREQAISGEVISPTLYLAAPSMNGNSVKSVEDGIAKVRSAKAEGWDLLKVHEGLTPEIYDAIVNTANEVGIEYGGHVSDLVGLDVAIAKGQRTVDHLDNYQAYLGAETQPFDDAMLARAVQMTVGSGTGVVPTMALWENFGKSADQLIGLDELKYVPQSVVEGWVARANRTTALPPSAEGAYVVANRRKLLKALSDGGVEILLGSDAPQLFSVPGFSLHREMAVMAEAGMSAYEIIRSGTASAGAYFADVDNFGTIAPGMRADLLLVNGNPLENVENIGAIEGVMTRGRWLSGEEISGRLAEMETRHAR